MPRRAISLAPVDPTTSDRVRETLLARFAAIREEVGASQDFPPDVQAEADRLAQTPPALPERDETSVPFITLDPPTSMDLDQAMCLERDGDGYRVRYAIADVPAFVVPGGAIDAEARRRGAERMALSVWSENMRAQAFYRRHGFEDRGPVTFMVGNHPDEDRVWEARL